MYPINDKVNSFTKNNKELPLETKAPSQEEANNKLVLKEALNKKVMDTR